MLAKEPPATGCLTPTKVLARTNEGAKTGSKRGKKTEKKMPCLGENRRLHDENEISRTVTSCQ
jgi:hypothetical protein